MDDDVCWADATPAARGPLRWMEPYQLEVPTWGVVERTLEEWKTIRVICRSKET